MLVKMTCAATAIFVLAACSTDAELGRASDRNESSNGGSDGGTTVPEGAGGHSTDPAPGGGGAVNPGGAGGRSGNVGSGRNAPSGTGGAGTGGEAPICTLIGCGPVQLNTHLSGVTYAELRTLSISVCRNDTCLSGDFSGLAAEPPDFGQGSGVSFPDPSVIDGTMSPHVNVIVNQGSGIAPFLLEIDWWPWNPDDLKDGDVYHIKATRPDGTDALNVQRTIARYTHSLPNGPGCGECVGATSGDTP